MNYFLSRTGVTIEKNIEGTEGYTVTMYNMDDVHPLWQNNIQMSPKRMKIVNKQENIIEFRGYGYDENALAIGASLEATSQELSTIKVNNYVYNKNRNRTTECN